jgi:hypothetical protein
MDTFARPLAERLSAGFEVDERRPPRRLTAMLAFAVLAVSGALGSYVAVLNGLGSLLAERSPGAGPYPLVAGTPDETESSSTAGMGRGRTHRTRPPGRVLVVPATTVAPPPPMVASRPPVKLRPGRSAGADCPDCLTPPVPTPTDPSRTGPSPTDPSPSGPTPSGPTPSGPTPSGPSPSIPAPQSGSPDSARGIVGTNSSLGPSERSPSERSPSEPSPSARVPAKGRPAPSPSRSKPNPGRHHWAGAK